MRIKKITLKTDRAILHKPEAKPSIPSIKLMAFVIYTTIKTVTGSPPKREPSTHRTSLPRNRTNYRTVPIINADTIWTANL